LPEALSFEQRFWSKVEYLGPDECWLWKAGKLGHGYGMVWNNQKNTNVAAHRTAYELMVGEIPDGLTIDHLCRNRACVNPNHMEAVSRGENVLRGVGPTAKNAQKDVCHRGHKFDGVHKEHGKDYRYCRSCARDKWTRANEAKRRRLSLVDGGS